MLIEALGHAGRDALGALRATLAESLEIAKRLARARGDNFPALARAIKPLVRTLSRLPAGCTLLIPGGSPVGGDLVYVVEKEKDLKDLVDLVENEKAASSSADGGRDEDDDKGTYRVAVVAAREELLGFHPASASAAGKVKYKTAWSLGGVSKERVCDPLWWAMALTMPHMAPSFDDQYPSDFDGATRQSGARQAVLYDWLLPWLIGRPLPSASDALDVSDCGAGEAEAEAEAGAEAEAAGECDDFRSPQRSQDHDYRAYLHACAWVLRRRGLARGAAKQAMLAIKAQMLALAEHDVSFLVGKVGSQSKVPGSQSKAEHDVSFLAGKGCGQGDRQLLKISGAQLCYAAAKLADGAGRPAKFAGASMGPRELGAVAAQADRLLAKVASLPALGDGEDSGPAILDLRGDVEREGRPQVGALHGVHRLPRHGRVDHLAGEPLVAPRYVPIDFLTVRPRVATLAGCLDALRWADRVCTLVSVQAYRVKRTSFLKVERASATIVLEPV